MMRKNLSIRSYPSVRIGCLWKLAAYTLLAFAFAVPAQAGPLIKTTVYAWSENRAIEPASLGRQRVEPALASDKEGRVWLSFLDTVYHQLPNQKWIAWPRKVPLYLSQDDGTHFQEQTPLSMTGGDESLTPNPAGGIFGSWIQYGYDTSHRLKQQAMLASFGGALLLAPTPCLLWDDTATAHDQTNVYGGPDGIVRLLAINIHPRSKSRMAVYYARWDATSKQCVDRQSLPPVGELPQMAASHGRVLIIGPTGYLVSRDNGASFELKPYRFADKLARIATSPDGQTVYVVGDAVSGGLVLYASDDGGDTWHHSRVDDASTASAWRFPAIHVEPSGRTHVIWMDDRNGGGALYHAYSDDHGRTFSHNDKISDAAFPFPKDAPPPPPANQNGTWVGDYLALTSVHGKLIAAWSDQRAGFTQSAIYVSVGAAHTE